MKSICLYILFTILPYLLYAQQATLNQRGIDMMTGQGGFVTEMKAVEKKSVGSAYLFDDYKESELIFLTGDTVRAAVNLNMQNNNVEVLLNDEIKFGNQNQISRIVISPLVLNRTFEYKQLEIDNKDYFGLAEILYKGNSFDVYRIFDFKVKEGYYVPALDVGNNDLQYLIDDKLIYVNENEKASEISLRSKKKFSKSFPGQSNEVYSYIKQNNIDYKEPKGQLKIFKFIESNK